MTLASFAFILTGVLLNAGAQLLLKAGTNAEPLGLRLAIEPHILAGLACYVVSVVVWVVALSKVPVSMAYPMLSIGYVVVHRDMMEKTWFERTVRMLSGVEELQRIPSGAQTVAFRVAPLTR